jgi:hypothetical protein
MTSSRLKLAGLSRGGKSFEHFEELTRIFLRRDEQAHVRRDHLQGALPR